MQVVEDSVIWTTSWIEPLSYISTDSNNRHSSGIELKLLAILSDGRSLASNRKCWSLRRDVLSFKYAALIFHLYIVCFCERSTVKQKEGPTTTV